VTRNQRRNPVSMSFGFSDEKSTQKPGFYEFWRRVISNPVASELYSASVPARECRSRAGTLALSMIKIYNSDAIGNDMTRNQPRNPVSMSFVRMLEVNLGFEASSQLCRMQSDCPETLILLLGFKNCRCRLRSKNRELSESGFGAQLQWHYFGKLVSDARMTKSNRCTGQAVV